MRLEEPKRRKVGLNVKRELAEKEEQENPDRLLIWASDYKATVPEGEWEVT